MAQARIRSLSRPPLHHFFGYYAVNAWDKSGRYHLALETDFHDHRPRVGDVAQVGLLDSTNGQFERLSQTAAFNLQQGSMMFWIDAGAGEEFTHNDWEDGRLVSRAINPHSGGRRTIDGALAAVSPAGPVGIGLNFARMALCRPVVGYAGPLRADQIQRIPDDDGLWRLDLATGRRELMLSIAQVIAARRVELTGPAWFNHVYINPAGRRVMFVCRIRTTPMDQESEWVTSMWTVNLDGTGLHCQIPYGHWVSHFAWLDDRRILVSTDAPGEPEFYSVTDGQDDFKPFGGGVLTGHAAFSPNGRWIVFDTGPDRQSRRQVALYDLVTQRHLSLGHFHHPPPFRGDIRCDPHPRWRADGRAITFDSIHEGTRQIYLADVSEILSQQG